MKSKYTVTIVKEAPIVEILDETLAKDILRSLVQLKSNPFENTNRSELKVEKEKVTLKHNRKWFNRYKYFKLNQIRKFFLFDTAPEYVLIYLEIDEFFGYVILKIDIAGQMIEFTELLKDAIGHEHTTTVNGHMENGHVVNGTMSNGSVSKKSDDQSNETVVINESILVNFNDNHVFNDTETRNEEVFHYEHATVEPELESFVSISGNNFVDHDSVDACRKRIITVYPLNSDEVTYVNYNCRDVVVDEGPVSLYSKTYASVYNRNNDYDPNHYDSVESETDSCGDEINIF